MARSPRPAWIIPIAWGLGAGVVVASRFRGQWDADRSLHAWFAAIGVPDMVRHFDSLILSIAAAFIGAVIASTLPFPVVALAADLGASALEGDMPPSLIAARRVMGYASLSMVSVMVAKIGCSAIKTAIQFATKGGGKWVGARSADSLTGRAKEWKDRKAGGCGCFAAGVLVWYLTRWMLGRTRFSTGGLYPVITMASAFVAFGAEVA